MSTFGRTAELAFTGLPGYAYPPRHLELGGAGGPRMAYVDEGAREHPTVLLLHGLPTWSYLYRHVIPILVEAGCRVVAPDLIGCGQSDKPDDPAQHGFAAHVGWLTGFVSALELRGLTLVCEDVGAILGLRLVSDSPERFARVVALNPALPGAGELPPGLARWAELAGRAAWPRASALVREQIRTPLEERAAAGYDAPFPDGADRLAALAAWVGDAGVIAAGDRVLGRLPHFLGPLAIALSETDPRSRAAAERIAAAAPGARWLSGPVTEAGRLIAEDRGPELAAEILALIRGA